MGCSAGQRGEQARGRWVGHLAAQRVAARQSRSAWQIWELYFLVLESILSPWVTTIQRWWRARGRERVPPFYAANVVLRRLTEKGLLAHVRAMGEHLEAALQPLIGPGRPARRLRGRGLLRGLELKEACPELPVVARQHGLMIGMVAAGAVVRLAPPLVIRPDELDALAAALGAALEDAYAAPSA